MKRVFFTFLSAFALCFFVSISFAQQNEETKTAEVPPEIQKILDNELQSLPPVERHFRKAQNYHASGKLDEAISELGLAMKEDSAHVPSNCELGVVYLGQENYDKAIEQLEKALKLDKTYPKTHYALANAYARKSPPDVMLARKYLDESIRLGYHPVPWFLEYMKKLESKEDVAN